MTPPFDSGLLVCELLPEVRFQRSKLWKRCGHPVLVFTATAAKDKEKTIE